MVKDLEWLKQRIPLLDYLQRHNWRPCRAGSRQEFMGLCPLHQETRPSAPAPGSFHVHFSANHLFLGSPPIDEWRRTTNQAIPLDSNYYGTWWKR